MAQVITEEWRAEQIRRFVEHFERERRHIGGIDLRHPSWKQLTSSSNARSRSFLLLDYEILRFNPRLIVLYRIRGEDFERRLVNMNIARFYRVRVLLSIYRLFFAAN